MNASELLVEPPIESDLPRMVGLWVRDILTKQMIDCEGIALWSRGTAYQVGKGIAEAIGAVGNSLRANREHLTPHDDDHARNTGRLVGHPSGFGWYEAYMPTSWRSRRSSLSQGKPGTWRRATGFKAIEEQ